MSTRNILYNTAFYVNGYTPAGGGKKIDGLQGMLTLGSESILDRSPEGKKIPSEDPRGGRETDSNGV